MPKHTRAPHAAPTAKQLQLATCASPLGELLLVHDAGRLCALDYHGCERRMLRLLARRYGEVVLVPGAPPPELCAALGAYFGGALGALDALPVSTGGTPFQERVWGALRAIPPGAVRSYGRLAAELGSPSSARAVGLANSLNPVSIVVPCHRLVGADGTLTGYAGGLERKAWLLAHERLHATSAP